MMMMMMMEQDKMTQVFDELVFEILSNKFTLTFENTLNTYSLINLIFRPKNNKTKTLFFKLSFSF